MKIGKGHLKALDNIYIAIATSEAEEALQKVFAEKSAKILEELARDPKALAAFFAAVEHSANARAAQAITTHPMRPDEAAAKVAAPKTEAPAI